MLKIFRKGLQPQVYYCYNSHQIAWSLSLQSYCFKYKMMLKRHYPKSHFPYSQQQHCSQLLEFLHRFSKTLIRCMKVRAYLKLLALRSVLDWLRSTVNDAHEKTWMYTNMWLDKASKARDQTFSFIITLHNKPYRWHLQVRSSYCLTTLVML